MVRLGRAQALLGINEREKANTLVRFARESENTSVASAEGPILT